jgi:hypothetical protein
MGGEFRNVSEDIFELIMVRHPEYRDHQPGFKLYPELKSFGTGDLWSPHSSKEGLWRYEGGGRMLLCLRVERGSFRLWRKGPSRAYCDASGNQNCAFSWYGEGRGCIVG